MILHDSYKLQLNDLFHDMMQEKFNHVYTIKRLEFWHNTKGMTKTGAILRIKNATIEQTFLRFTARFNTFLHKDQTKDFCECSNRAIHFGVKIGDLIQVHNIPHKNYNDRKALVYKYLRKLALKQNVLDKGLQCKITTI
jgi:pimeloyl-CoA synthetase